MARVTNNKVELRTVAGENEISCKRRMIEFIIEIEKRIILINILRFDRHIYLSINNFQSFLNFNYF